MRRPAISLATRFRILQRDRFRCRYCGRHAGDVELEIDHVIAVACGGTHDDSNLCAACRDCNRGKVIADLSVAVINRPDRDFAAATLGALGGKARARNLTPDQRSESSRKAAQARWKRSQHAAIDPQDPSDPHGTDRD